MDQSINIYPVLATWKVNRKTGLCPLHMAIDINNRRASFPSLKRKILPYQWDEVSKKVINMSGGMDQLINILIEKRKRELETEFIKKQLLGIKITRAIVKKQAKGYSGSNDFFAFATEQIRLQGYSRETIRTYKSELNKLKRFSPVLTFNDLDYSFLQNYRAYLLEKENGNNTIWKSFKFISRICSLAMLPAFSLLASDPFENFNRGKYEQKIPKYLEWKEILLLLEKLRNKEVLEYDTETVGYYFLLCCFSGFRFSDCSRFKYDKFIYTDNNTERLILSTKKSGQIVSIAVNKYIKEVINAIKDRPLNMDNHLFNRHLKIIDGICSYGKDLKCHMGRHSFAMRLAELGFSEDDAQILLGHKNKTSTKVYFRIKNTRLDEAMKKWE